MIFKIIAAFYGKLFFCVDNINIDAGSTLTVGTDQIAGVHYQVVKMAHGEDGSIAHASWVNPVPVTIISATLGTLTVSPNNTSVTVNNVIHAIVDSGNINISSATLGTVTVGGNVNISSATLGTLTITGTTVVTSGNINISSATLGTLTITGTTVVTSGNINISSATLGTLTITGTTVVTSGNINVSSATLGTVTITGSITNSVSTIPIVGRTLTGSTGTFTATNASVTLTPTNRAKVFGFSLTTTWSTEVICVFHTGGLELWRVTLAAPSGSSAGANLAVAPPAYLFASRSGTAVSLSLSTAAMVHFSTAYFDEA